MAFTAKDYLNQLVTFDGEERKLGEAIKILNTITTNQRLIDRYVQGLLQAKRIRQRTEVSE